MKNIRKTGSIAKKAAAVALSFVMVFGMAAALPDSVAQKAMTSASAYNIVDGGHTFYFEKLDNRNVRINGVSLGDKVVNVPGTITLDGIEYTVTEIGDNFGENCSIYALTIPDSVVKIGDNFAVNTPMDTLYLPDNLEYIGDYFCYNCPTLRSVNYSGTKLTHLGIKPFMGENLNSYHFRYKNNSKLATCFGNWILAYYGKESNIKVADLGTDAPVKYIASDAFTPPGALYYDPKDVVSVDLEGISYIGDGAFTGCVNLAGIVSGDSVEYTGDYALFNTKWFSDKKQDGKIVLGKSLLWYRTNDEVVDLTGEEFRGLRQVNKHALQGCSNAEGIKADPSLDITEVELPKTIENGKYNDELNALSTLTVDNKDIGFDSKKPVDPSLSKYANMLSGTQLEADLLRDKTKAVFGELGIKYYGIGTFTADLTVAESYDIVKKIHDYIGENYTFGPEAKTLVDGYLAGQRMDSEKFAALYAYMLRCAGIDCLIVKSDMSGFSDLNSHIYDHSWVLVDLGGNWYHSDVCWDSASQSNSLRYFLLSDSAVKELRQHSNWEISNPLGLNVFDVSEVPECKILNGDTNGDGHLDANDLEAYMGILKTKTVEASEASDVDLDGDTDIDDMLRLDDLLNKQVSTPTNIYSKPANEIMAKDTSVYEPVTYSVGQVKIIVASDTKIYNDDFLLSDYNGNFELPKFEYKTSSYEKFEKWEAGKPGETVQFTKPVVILRPVWEDNSNPDTSKKGDVNADGTVDIVDAVTVISHINGTHVMSNKAMKTADVNLDSKIDIEDAVLLIGYVNGNNTL